jgi:hypothetical protein
MLRPVCETHHSRWWSGKEALVDGLLAAKESSGKTFTQIANETGLTNLYAAQLFYAQVRCLSPQCK